VSELLTENNNGATPLDCAKYNPFHTVLPFVTEVDTAFHNTDYYPALIPLCGSTPDWEKKTQHYRDKKKAEEEAEADKLAASFFEWDEEDSKKKQPEKKKKKPNKEKEKEKEKKEVKVELNLAEQMADMDAQLERLRSAPALSLAEQMADVERKIDDLPTLTDEVSPPPPPLTDEEVLRTIYLKRFECECPRKMKLMSILLACEADCDLPSESPTEERISTLKLIVPN